MDEIKTLLSNCFDRLQSLNITPTKANMEILLKTLYDLQDAYKKLEGMADNGRQTADAE